MSAIRNLIDFLGFADGDFFQVHSFPEERAAAGGSVGAGRRAVARPAGSRDGSCERPVKRVEADHVAIGTRQNSELTYDERPWYQ